MIVQNFYLTMTEENADDPIYDTDKQIHPSVKVPKLGKFLYGLSPTDDMIFSVYTTPDSEITENGNYLDITNVIIKDKQCLTVDLVDTILNIHSEDVYNNNGALLYWAFEHEFRSVFINYLGKYPTMCKYIEPIIYHNLGNRQTWHTNMMIWLIDRYKYDITKDENRLFTTAAMCKNLNLCEYLLEEKEALIPANVYKIFMSFGKKRFGYMYELLRRYSDRVLLS